jgi:hypothetical protein
MLICYYYYYTRPSPFFDVIQLLSQQTAEFEQRYKKEFLLKGSPLYFIHELCEVRGGILENRYQNYLENKQEATILRPGNIVKGSNEEATRNSPRDENKKAIPLKHVLGNDDLLINFHKNHSLYEMQDVIAAHSNDSNHQQTFVANHFFTVVSFNKSHIGDRPIYTAYLKAWIRLLLQKAQVNDLQSLKNIRIPLPDKTTQDFFADSLNDLYKINEDILQTTMDVEQSLLHEISKSSEEE